MHIGLAIALGFLPSLIWLAFFLKEDEHPEPKKMILKVYLMGGVSALAALALQYAVNVFVPYIPIILPDIHATNASPFLIFGAIEEIVKFFFVYLVVKKSRYFDEPVDAMIYMITGALGFAALENFFVVLSNGFDGVFGLIVLRFIGATLLHALSSAIVGHHWARGIKFNMVKKLTALGLVLAIVFHAVFNYLVIAFDNILIYPTFFLVLVGFFVLYDFEELKRMGR